MDIKKCRYIRAVFLLTVIMLFFWMSLPVSVNAQEPIVIVLDPGHGGNNLGAEYDGYTEKDLTIEVARAMKEQLEKYDNVKVYLTREGDESMDIRKRAEFAAKLNADFLFCLHFNASVNHNLFGSEVWVPSTGSYYSKGYSYAQIQMQQMTDMGLYSRGIKTRLGEGDHDYYGILRYCTELGVPSVLIEHCHLDNEMDQGFYQQGKQQLIEFGRQDAEAVAKYFQLSSAELGVDYSSYPVPQTPIPSGIVRPDATKPEVCKLEVTKVDQDTGEVTLQMRAKDKDSYILYYSYSTNGGNTYSSLMEWPRTESWNQSDENYSVTVSVPYEHRLKLRVCVYNGFDVRKESNIVIVDPIPGPGLEEIKARYRESDYQKPAVEEPESSLEVGVIVLVLVVLLLLLMCLVTYVLVKTLIALKRNNKTP